MGRGVPHGGEVALEVHRDDSVELLFAGVGDHPVPHDAGIVHQDVHTTVRLDGGLDQVGRLVPVRDVRPVGDGLATGRKDLVDHVLGCAAAACRRTVQAHTDIVDHHARTLGREGQRMCAADAATRSGDDDHPAVDQAHDPIAPLLVTCWHPWSRPAAELPDSRPARREPLRRWRPPRRYSATSPRNTRRPKRRFEALVSTARWG